MVHGEHLSLGRDLTLFGEIRAGRHVSLADHVTANGRIVMGDEVSIGEFSKLQGDITLDRQVRVLEFAKLVGRIKVGERSFIGERSYLNAGTGIENSQIMIGKNVLIANDVYVASAQHEHRFQHPINNQGYRASPVVIRDDAWIGTKAVILPGVEIGEGSVVGAGAVVNRSLPSRVVAVGVPAKVMKRLQSGTRGHQKTGK